MTSYKVNLRNQLHEFTREVLGSELSRHLPIFDRTDYDTFLSVINIGRGKPHEDYINEMFKPSFTKYNLIQPIGPIRLFFGTYIKLNGINNGPEKYTIKHTKLYGGEIEIDVVESGQITWRAGEKNGIETRKERSTTSTANLANGRTLYGRNELVWEKNKRHGRDLYYLQTTVNNGVPALPGITSAQITIKNWHKGYLHGMEAHFKVQEDYRRYYRCFWENGLKAGVEYNFSIKSHSKISITNSQWDNGKKLKELKVEIEVQEDDGGKTYIVDVYSLRYQDSELVGKQVEIHLEYKEDDKSTENSYIKETHLKHNANIQFIEEYDFNLNLKVLKKKKSESENVFTYIEEYKPRPSFFHKNAIYNINQFKFLVRILFPNLPVFTVNNLYTYFDTLAANIPVFAGDPVRFNDVQNEFLDLFDKPIYINTLFYSNILKAAPESVILSKKGMYKFGFLYKEWEFSETVALKDKKTHAEQVRFSSNPAVSGDFLEIDSMLDDGEQKNEGDDGRLPFMSSGLGGRSAESVATTERSEDRPSSSLGNFTPRKSHQRDAPLYQKLVYEDYKMRNKRVKTYHIPIYVGLPVVAVKDKISYFNYKKHGNVINWRDRQPGNTYSKEDIYGDRKSTVKYKFDMKHGIAKYYRANKNKNSLFHSDKSSKKVELKLKTNKVKGKFYGWTSKHENGVTEKKFYDINENVVFYRKIKNKIVIRDSNAPNLIVKKFYDSGVLKSVYNIGSSGVVYNNQVFSEKGRLIEYTNVFYGDTHGWLYSFSYANDRDLVEEKAERKALRKERNLAKKKAEENKISIYDDEEKARKKEVDEDLNRRHRENTRKRTGKFDPVTTLREYFMNGENIFNKTNFNLENRIYTVKHVVRENKRERDFEIREHREGREGIKRRRVED